MRIKADLIRAAVFFTAKKDPREYLTGFHITSKHIEATNGHIAVQIKHESKRVKKGIYLIRGRIPAKSEYIEFIIRNDLNIVRFYDDLNVELGVSGLDVIDGVFPNLSEKVIKPLVKEPIDNTETPRVNPDYIGLVGKAFCKGGHYKGIDLEFRGLNSAIVIKPVGSYMNEVYGNPVIIIMPMRTF